MSAESGLKTFRDADGLWENYPVQQVASHEGWERDPKLVTEFYNERRRQLVKAKPNEGHRLVAGLEKHYNVTVITQNVDNLHEQAGSSKVIHLHGELMKVCSSRDTENQHFWQTLTEDNCEVIPGTKAGDGSLLRPYIVFFGESVPMIEPAIIETENADIHHHRNIAQRVSRGRTGAVCPSGHTYLYYRPEERAGTAEYEHPPHNERRIGGYARTVGTA